MTMGLRAFLAGLLMVFAAPGARAAVEISFFSHELGDTFPHAFIRLRGTDDRVGAKVENAYGFTAVTVSPAVLMGSVHGEILSSKPAYIAKSNEHFRFTLTDLEYDDILRGVHKWRTLKQPSYNLNRQNCVFFVADMAVLLGMTVPMPKALMKKPRSFTDSLVTANRAWLTARGATLLREPPAVATARRR